MDQLPVLLLSHSGSPTDPDNDVGGARGEAPEVSGVAAVVEPPPPPRPLPLLSLFINITFSQAKLYLYKAFQFQGQRMEVEVKHQYKDCKNSQCVWHFFSVRDIL